MAHINTARTKIKEGLVDARYFLQDIAELADWALSDKRWMGLPQYQDWKRQEKIRWKKWKINELKRRKWIETRKIGDEMCTRLTAAGWQMALRDRIRLENKKCKNGICILIFDIPEKQRALRRILRLFIKECGFTQLQRSVWITDKDVIQPLMLLLQRRNLDQWVRIIQGRILTSSALTTLKARTTQSPRSPQHIKLQALNTQARRSPRPQAKIRISN